MSLGNEGTRAGSSLVLEGEPSRDRGVVDRAEVPERQELRVGGFPERGQQSIYVEFDDAATAESYARDQLGGYSVLFAGSQVVVTGSGLNPVDMAAYLADLQEACGCGEVIAAEY